MKPACCGGWERSGGWKRALGEGSGASVDPWRLRLICPKGVLSSSACGGGRRGHVSSEQFLPATPNAPTPPGPGLSLGRALPWGYPAPASSSLSGVEQAGTPEPGQPASQLGVGLAVPWISQPGPGPIPGEQPQAEKAVSIGCPGPRAERGACPRSQGCHLLVAGGNRCIWSHDGTTLGPLPPIGGGALHCLDTPQDPGAG